MVKEIFLLQKKKRKNSTCATALIFIVTLNRFFFFNVLQRHLFEHRCLFSGMLNIHTVFEKTSHFY